MKINRRFCISSTKMQILDLKIHTSWKFPQNEFISCPRSSWKLACTCNFIISSTFLQIFNRTCLGYILENRFGSSTPPPLPAPAPIWKQTDFLASWKCLRDVVSKSSNLHIRFECVKFSEALSSLCIKMSLPGSCSCSEESSACVRLSQDGSCRTQPRGSAIYAYIRSEQTRMKGVSCA